MLAVSGIEALHTEGNQAREWNRVDLREVLKLMEDLIDYFAQPNDEMSRFSLADADPFPPL